MLLIRLQDQIRTRSCAAHRRPAERAKLRRSPLTEYWRAGNVTFRRSFAASQTANPTAEAAQILIVEMQFGVGKLPGGVPLSLAAIFTTIVRSSPGGVSGESRRTRAAAVGICVAREMPVEAFSRQSCNQQSQSHLFRRPRRRHNSGCHRASESVNWRRCSRAQQDHLRERQRLRMCNGEEGGGGAHPRVADCRPTLKSQERGTALPHYFDVAPEDAVRMSRTERLHRRLFRGEPAREMRRRVSPPGGVGDLPLGENATEKPIAESSNGRFDPVDLRGVDAEADDIHLL